MFNENLEKYKINGSFSFKPSEIFSDKCNAPDNKSGVYLIYKIIDNEEILIYIGASGQRKKDGTLKIRIGAMKDRLINGYHPNRFGETKRIKRHKAFLQQMLTEGIQEIKVYWWVTYHNAILDFPIDIEKILIKKYQKNNFNKRPAWHKQNKIS